MKDLIPNNRIVVELLPHETCPPIGACVSAGVFGTASVTGIQIRAGECKLRLVEWTIYPVIYIENPTQPK